VVANSTASKIGILEGDIIVSFDGQSITKPFDLTHLMSLKKASDRAALQILRGDQTINLEAKFESDLKMQ
jgi:S1-C subfamily serine protease